MLFCHIEIAAFSHARIVMYFPRCLIPTTMTTCFAVVMTFLGKYYAHISELFMCERSNLYVTKQHSDILHKHVSEKIIH